MTNNYETIKNTPFPVWKSQIEEATEKEHKQRLISECHKIENGQSIPKTKTAHIIEKINNPSFKRKPIDTICNFSKHECRTMIIARNGMLVCGKNFRGTINYICPICNTIDNEEHRLNECVNYESINYSNSDEKIPFETIYSDDQVVLKTIFERINKVWNVKTGRGAMNNV